MVSRTTYAVTVNGQNITSSLSPRLLQLKVTDKAGSSSDAATIDLDDRDQVLQFPKKGADMRVTLLGVEVFVGKVDEVRASGARGQGRTLKITAKGLDTASKVKERKHKHIDKKKISEAIKDAGQDAGVTDVTVDPDLDEERDYFALDGESVMGFAQRMADEIGGVFRIRDNKIVIAKQGAGKTPTGQTLPTIRAVWGGNLQTYDITPVIGRTSYKKVASRYYDQKEAKWKEVETETEDTDATATHAARHSVKSEKHGKAKNKKSKADVEDKKGDGTVVIDLNPAARPEGKIVVSGARVGCDGTYSIEAVDHTVTRTGSTTSVTLKKPDADAGKDTRKVKPK